MENFPMDEEQSSLIDLLAATARSLEAPPHIDLTSKAATDYLHRLTSLPLGTLQLEPARIADESSFVEGELTNLCFREQRTFIDVHRCADDVQGAFDEFGHSLDRLVGAVPPLEKECESFAKSTRGIQQDRKMATLVLEHQDKLLDLLEIPQLLDTCVRNGYYQEAMELSAHAASLAERYGDIPIVLSVQAEVLNVMQLQLSQLLTLLREPVKLPTLVKAVSFLRRMGDIPEPELRVAFLESREYNFRTQLGQLERDRHDRVRYTRKYIDLFRENVYDSISQYSSIFLDPAILKSASRSEVESATNILVLFCHHSLDNLLDLINQNIPLITDTSSLSSLLTQLGYCSLSFARVGMDFSAQIAGPFEAAVLELIKNGFKDASLTLRQSFKDAGRLSQVPSAWLCTGEALGNILRSSSSPPPFPAEPTSLNIPPQFLSSYPPLAIYTNSTLSTLNSLRLLAPLSLLNPLLSALETTLSEIINDFITYARVILHETSSALTRPSHNRRNPSVGNQGIATEVRIEREKEATRVLCAFGGAILAGVHRYLRRALVEGVYDAGVGSLNALESQTILEDAVADLQGWVREHGVKEDATRPTEETKSADEAAPAAASLVVNGTIDLASDPALLASPIELSDKELQEQISQLEAAPIVSDDLPAEDAPHREPVVNLPSSSSEPILQVLDYESPLPAAVEAVISKPAVEVVEIDALPLVPESGIPGGSIIVEQAPMDPLVEPSVRAVSDSVAPDLVPAAQALEAVALHGDETLETAGAPDGEPLGEPLPVHENNKETLNGFAPPNPLEDRDLSSSEDQIPTHGPQALTGDTEPANGQPTSHPVVDPAVPEQMPLNEEENSSSTPTEEIDHETDEIALAEPGSIATPAQGKKKKRKGKK